MEKSIEMRVAELEKQVFHTKNVLSFEEASRFLNLSAAKGRPRREGRRRPAVF